MGIFRPQQQSTGGNKYMGVVETAIAEYTDRSSEFDWADVFIEVTLNIKDSQYTRPLRIAGALDKNTEGKVTGGSVLNRLYKFFDVIKCKAGLNVSGEWEDENGEYLGDPPTIFVNLCLHCYDWSVNVDDYIPNEPSEIKRVERVGKTFEEIFAEGEKWERDTECAEVFEHSDYKCDSCDEVLIEGAIVQW